MSKKMNIEVGELTAGTSNPLAMTLVATSTVETLSLKSFTHLSRSARDASPIYKELCEELDMREG